MAARIDIPSVYDEVRKAYAGMGYPVSGDRLVVSEQPTYVDGRPVPKDVISPNSSGGNTQDDGTVRVNPRYRAVMRHWGLKGSGRDFLRTIIGHELGHHVDRTVLSRRSAERRRLLLEIRKSGFHTVYTDSYGPDTDRRKLDKELLAEYLAHVVSGKIHGLQKKAARTRASDVRKVMGLVADLVRNKPRPVPMRSVVDAVRGRAVFRGSTWLPALQEAYAAKRGITPDKLRVHVSPSSGVVSEYAGAYQLGASGRGTSRRGGFLQVVTSGLGKIKSGKQPLSRDYGAARLTGAGVSRAQRGSHRARNLAALDRPYDLDVSGAFEAILPAKSLADARVYAVSVVPGYRPKFRTPDYDHIMLTGITRVNRLAKIRNRHPELARYIDPAISRYMGERSGGVGVSVGSMLDSSEARQYLPRARRRNLFAEPPEWQLPRRLRNSDVVD